MRTITNKEMSLEYFSDIYEFANALNRPVNRIFTGREHSQNEKKRKDTFYGTRTYAEADNLLRNGYDEGLRAIVGAMPNIKAEDHTPITKADVVGHTPHVPHCIIGHPMNMIRTIRQPLIARSINVWFDRSEACDVKAEEMAESARLLIDAVKWLEDHNIRVTVNIISSGICAVQKVFCAVCVKKATALINVRKIAYPMVHPSWERRHCFRWMETSPIVTASDLSDYGFSFNIFGSVESRRKKLVDNGVIGQNDVYLDGISIRSVNTANEVVEMIVSQSQLTERS